LSHCDETLIAGERSTLNVLKIPLKCQRSVLCLVTWCGAWADVMTL